ncbi:DUF2057 domain-containing protein [Pseudomonas nitroreducens]|uniref:PA0061/PA0062 family lipoprotein n=1 Tax=Pseudomonas nitroreducens TaxID=46680 RepID=UPI001474D0F1|nr:hypothetical protein [Pseudomonas nitroreducens]MDG9852336.1 DUF2057 domain-containing protein [Pseudomonas nitroreducens]NMZ76338.1 DUF2057 domain-containing protein [Pseudomonas nitroreducens]
MRPRLLPAFIPLSLALLAGCASPLPAHDPQLAWIDLYTAAGRTLMAERLDGKSVNDGRYYQVTPGRHELLVRFQYEIPSGGGMGAMSDPSELTCRVKVTYDDFAAGQRYRLELRPQLRSALALLTDASGQLVAKTDFQGPVSCGPF